MPQALLVNFINKKQCVSLKQNTKMYTLRVIKRKYVKHTVKCPGTPTHVQTLEHCIKTNIHNLFFFIIRYTNDVNLLGLMLGKKRARTFCILQDQTKFQH